MTTWLSSDVHPYWANLQDAIGGFFVIRIFAQEQAATWTEAAIFMVLVGLVMVAAGFAVVWVAGRAADGRLGVNAIAGIRTKATRASPEAWLVAHQVAERPTKLGGWAAVASALLGPPIGLILGGGDPERSIVIYAAAIGIGTALLTGLAILGAVRGQRAAVAASQRS